MGKVAQTNRKPALATPTTGDKIEVVAYSSRRVHAGGVASLVLPPTISYLPEPTAAPPAHDTQENSSICERRSLSSLPLEMLASTTPLSTQGNAFIGWISIRNKDTAESNIKRNGQARGKQAHDR